MLTIIPMGVIVYTAGTIIGKVGCYDQYHRKWKEPELVFVPYLFGKQQEYACGKEPNGGNAVMVLFIAMPEGVYSNSKGQRYHEIFELYVIYNVNTKDG
jgi:hypothetical protein